DWLLSGKLEKMGSRNNDEQKPGKQHQVFHAKFPHMPGDASFARSYCRPSPSRNPCLVGSCANFLKKFCFTHARGDGEATLAYLQMANRVNDVMESGAR